MQAAGIKATHEASDQSIVWKEQHLFIRATLLVEAAAGRIVAFLVLAAAVVDLRIFPKACGILITFVPEVPKVLDNQYGCPAEGIDRADTSRDLLT